MRDPSHAILSIGTLAADWLAGGQGGRVLASVTRAIYLLSEQNELLWITPQPGPMHRRCILVSAPLPSMEAGVEFETKNGLLTTGAREALEFASASIWRPPVITRFETIDARALRPLVHGIYRQLTAQEKPLGWGGLIPEVLRGGEGQPALGKNAPSTT